MELLLLSTVPADRLNLPSILVLNSCGISRAGDQVEIAAFCSHVMELDLSHNKLRDWNEVLVLQLPEGLFSDHYAINSKKTLLL